MSCVSERVLEARRDMQLIKQRMFTRDYKVDTARLALLEEHLALIAGAIDLVLEMKEKGL